MNDVSVAGDWDGDGILELALSGRASLPGYTQIDIVRGTDGSLLTTILGTQLSEIVGLRMICPGDLDGDGFEDLLVSGIMPQGAGSALLYFVRAYSSATGQVLYEVPGFHINDVFGSALAASDDINGDGVPEILVGAPAYSSPGLDGIGAVAVLDGSSGQVLYTLYGGISYGYLGSSVAGLDDLDSDGVGDFLVGEYGASLSGAAHVFSAATGSLIRSHFGRHAYQLFGGSVALWGDQDGDGFSEYLVGAAGDNTLGVQEGAVYGFSGSDGSLALSLFPDPVHQFDERFGSELSGGVDVDGDGLNDFVVGFNCHKNGYLAGGVEVYGSSGNLLYGCYGHRETEFLGTLGSGPKLTPDYNGDGRPEILVHSIRPLNGGPAGGKSATLYSGWDDIPILRIPSHRAGTFTTVEISNAIPGSAVHVGYSAGPGPISTPLGPVSLSSPVQLLPPIWVGANGSGAILSRVPVPIKGMDVYLQAVEVSPQGGYRLSLPLWVVVQ